MGIFECQDPAFDNEEDCPVEQWGQFGRDACGVCGGSNDSDGFMNNCFDCGGEPGGGAFINACGACECGVGGNIIDISDGCNLPANNIYVTDEGEVLYHATDTLSGIQFQIDGASVNDYDPAYGGDTGNAGPGWGFWSSDSVDLMGAISSLNSYIEPGCGVLFNLNITGVVTGLSDIIVADVNADPVSFEYYSSDCIVDAVCEFDCAGEEGGTRELDDCGICREPNCQANWIDLNNETLEFGCASLFKSIQLA
jgi:hypothetical protein